MQDLLKSSFGELLVAEPVAVIQNDAIYGIRSKTDNSIYVDKDNSGAVVVSENSNGTKEFKISSGTLSTSFGLLRSIRTVRYRPGQGSRFMFTARFTTPSLLNDQTVGPYNYGNHIAFGYNGINFGILFKTGGLPEIRTLTLTVGAGGNENVTITLNGVAKVVAVTAGTTAITASQLALETYPGWEVSSLGATVQFVAKNDTVFSGAFTLTSTGTTAGTFATTKAGITATSLWIPQSQWNVDKCNGSGPSGFNLNPLKGNVYRITFQYLGYGPINYFIEGQNKKFILVHQIDYPNLYETPSFSIPNFKMGIYSRNYGSTTNISVYSGSFSGFVDGIITKTRSPDSKSFSKASIGTTRIPVISIRNKTAFNNTWNLNSLILESASFAIDGAKPGIAEIIINGTLTGAIWTSQDLTNSTAEYDTSATAITLGSNAQIIHTRALARLSDAETKFNGEDIILEANEIVTLCITASSTTVDAACAIDWYED